MLKFIASIIIVLATLSGCATIEVHPPAQRPPMPNMVKPKVLHASFVTIAQPSVNAKESRVDGGALGDGTVVVSFQVKDVTGNYHFKAMEWYTPSPTGAFTKYLGTGESIPVELIAGDQLRARNPSDSREFYEWTVTDAMARAINVNFYRDHKPKVFGEQ